MSNDHQGHHHANHDARLHNAAAEGCEESRLLISRRAILGMSAGLCAWSFLPKSATAEISEKRMLIVVLRGGLDGLHVAFPSSQKDALNSRRNGIYTSQYLDTYADILGTDPQGQSVSFKLHPKLANFRNLFRGATSNGQKQATLLHSVAPPVRTQSHFDCQDSLENGYPGQTQLTQDGWLNRLLTRMPSGNAINAKGLTPGIAIGQTPLIMRGAADVCSWSFASLNSFGAQFDQDMLARYDARSRGSDPYGINGKFAHQLKLGIDTNNYVGTSASMTQDSVVNSFIGAAALMSQVDGPRLGVLSVGGLDTHTSEILTLDGKLQALDDGLLQFQTVMGNAWSNSVVVFVTEFGRTIDDNSLGTDHGTGTVALLAGGAVDGGKILGGSITIPESRNPNITDTGIGALIDTRALFKGLLIEHLDVADSAVLNQEVFPLTGRDSSSPVPALQGLINHSRPASPAVPSTAGLVSVPLTNDDRSQSTISTYRATKRPRSATAPARG